jgi:hypothetical protein
MLKKAKRSKNTLGKFAERLRGLEQILAEDKISELMLKD